MVRRKARKTSSPEAQDEAGFIESFEKEYSRLLAEEGLEAAKDFFREKFMVSCFACGHMGKTVPPLNCARCGQYLD